MNETANDERVTPEGHSYSAPKSNTETSANLGPKTAETIETEPSKEGTTHQTTSQTAGNIRLQRIAGWALGLAILAFVVVNYAHINELRSTEINRTIVAPKNEPRLSGATNFPENTSKSGNQAGSPIDSIVESARKIEEAGTHERAGYYWRNAVEHASDKELLPVLYEYAEAVFKAKMTDETRYAEATMLERLAELALVRVSPNQIDEALALRDKCVAFHSSMITEMHPDDVETDDGEPESEPIAKTIADTTDKLLVELEQRVANYSGPANDRSTTEEECLILQLSGVAESSMTQLWFLDRDGLDVDDKKRIDAFPKRLADLIDQFNEKHATPLLVEIQSLAEAMPPKLQSQAPHQRNVEFYTNKVAEATAIIRHLRGTNAQTVVQKSIASVMEKVTDEKRKQMNEYQKFVANCCKMAFDSWNPVMGTGAGGYGRVPRNSGYKSELDFVGSYVRQFSRSVPLSKLVSQQNRLEIYKNDNLISQSLLRSTGGAAYYDVANHHKAFIVTAIYGFYRIDQSLLTPETSRLFNDVFGKFYNEMDATLKAWSVRWMVEEKKVRLEDF